MKSEFLLLGILFLLLILKVWDGIKNNESLLHAINIILILNFVAGFCFNSSGSLFSGMFYTNSGLALEKNILNFGVLIISLQAFNWLKNHLHLLEFYILLLSTLLGMFYMMSSGNFLMFYLGLELASIPLAALANFDLGRRKSSEAALKLILSSAFASGILLFGISILYGVTGSLAFSELPKLLTAGPLPVFALIFIFSGFAFKISSVPFHLWTADVYEGAPLSITAYLSVISKAAIVFVFISILAPLFTGLHGIWQGILLLSIVFTISIGNLFAIRQHNIKRFLAFSSITQVGYILLGLSSDNGGGTTASIYFLIVYLFSNLAAFGVIALVSSQTGKEEITDFRGFYKTNPVLSWVIALSMFSLAGIPPTAGFFGKMFLVTAGAGNGNYLLIGFAALNMVVSLYYYLRIVRTLFIDENEDPIPKLLTNKSVNISLILCCVGIIFTGFAGTLYDYISQAFKF
ncbi:MAG: NADH-quinone oxidoreductase subunit N [Bacteroidia bacterium]